MSKGVVLVADDDASVRMVINQALTRQGYDVRITSSFSNLWTWIENGEGDCVVSDVIMPDGEAFEVLPRIKKLRPELPVILISAQNTFTTALKAQDEEAFDYLPKPFDLDMLTDTVARAIFEPKNSALPVSQTSPMDEMPLVGRSSTMQEIYRTIARLRQSEYPVFLSGENGTGKSIIAKVLHDYSTRSNEAYVIANLNADSKEELDTILDALPGTIFLTEILDLTSSQQNTLLKRLREIESNQRAKPKLPRIISATSGDVHQAIRSGLFREDLFHRLAMVPIAIPPLRERLEDVSDLARYFLKQTAAENSFTHYIEPDGMRVLRNHLWPGNIRELENLIKRLCLLHQQETITAAMIEEQIAPAIDETPAFSDGNHVSFDTLSNATAYFVERYFDANNEPFPKDGIYPKFLAQMEQPLITATLRLTNGNQIKAAEILGLNRNTLRKKIQQHGIEIVKTVK